MRITIASGGPRWTPSKNALAARSVEDRPLGGLLFAKLQRGDIVIAAKLDRLFRSALDALKVEESLKTRAVKLHLLDLGGDIAGNGISRLFLTIAAAVAEAERDRIRG
jgi:putative DNA-invertase from lambdoid prophage Rac